MARRSSARLRSKGSSTPQRASLAHDAPAGTPRTVPTKLPSLDEDGEMPGAFPRSPKETPTRASNGRARGPVTTPKTTTPIKPPEEEMHPQAHHHTTAKPLDEARHLGFIRMGHYTEPPKQKGWMATLQGTPTRVQNPTEDVRSPGFQFTFRREQSLELSPAAKKLMDEKREEAAHIRELMAARRELPEEAPEAAGRKIAMPKGKKGRFSEAHMAAFQKMDSIAGHASAYRADPSRVKATPAADGTASAKSLKRKPSRAELDDPETRSRPMHYSPSKKALVRPGSRHAEATTVTERESSPRAKRVKRIEGEDVSAKGAVSSDEDKPLPATPGQHMTLHRRPSHSSLAGLSTPTQASLARASGAAFTNTSKIPAPALARSPSKPSLNSTKPTEDGPSTPLLARSPSKASLPSIAKSQKDTNSASHDPLLARTPLKGSPSKRPTDTGESSTPQPREAPLLSRSPLKMSVAKDAGTEADEDKRKPPNVPLLARSPSRIALPSMTNDPQGGQSPGKPPSSGLAGRLNLLRSSPMKSILRSPQRLYSNDPAKVAAGTHLATPKYARADNGAQRPLCATASLRKHVDFTSSTKARHSASQSPSDSGTPSKSRAYVGSAADEERVSTTPTGEPPVSLGYPDLSQDSRLSSPSPQKRRQTVTPRDFTFRAGEHGIAFAQSPNARAGTAKGKAGPPTIRHVSAEPVLTPTDITPPPTVQGSKKRKFEFENEAMIHSSGSQPKDDDKENVSEADDQDQRPAKRARPEPRVQASTKPTVTRVPTLGVKPKGAKTLTKDTTTKMGKPRAISQSRLNALAQPKKRG